MVFEFGREDPFIQGQTDDLALDHAFRHLEILLKNPSKFL
jgi:hypothetical protein